MHSILAQDVPGGLELLVVDGGSSDGTAELAGAAGATVVPNPQRIIPAALNVGLAAASGSVLVRFDAHSEMPPGYIGASLRTLDEEEGAVNTGGWLDVRSTGAWGRALRGVLGSRFGIGNRRLWRRPPEGFGRRDVETVPFGCFVTEELRAIGGWREDLLTNEDFELNHRLRRRGGRVVFDPDVWSIYRPRERYVELVRQYWRYGRWKATMLKHDPDSLRPRQLAPLALLTAVALACTPSAAAWPARGVLIAYALLVAGVTVVARGGWRVAPLLVTVHAAWGAGLVAGVLRGLVPGRRSAPP